MGRPRHDMSSKGGALPAMEKINSELLTMTYGAIVTQLIKDYKDEDVVNAELDKMGYNIGVRLIEEFLAKSKSPRCTSFKETGTTIAKVAFRMFLGINAEATKWSEDGKQFSVVFKQNPLNEFVQLPPQHLAGKLKFSNILCGVIRGALKMIRMEVVCEYARTTLRGHPENEIRVTLKQIMQETYADEED